MSLTRPTNQRLVHISNRRFDWLHTSTFVIDWNFEDNYSHTSSELDKKYGNVSQRGTNGTDR